MSVQGWVETLGWATGDGAALTASTTSTSILPGQAKITLPANFFDKVGKMVRVRATGRVTTVTTPGTLTLDVRFGSVVVANGGAMTLNATAQTNVTWDLEWILTCRAIGTGTAANMMHVGKFMSRALVGGSAEATAGAGTRPLPDTAPAVGTGFDSTAAQVVDLFATWSINNADSIQVHQYSIEALN